MAKTSRGTVKTTGFFTRRLRIPILLALLIALFNQFSGINAVFYFAPRLLGLAGLEDTLKASVALGLTNLVFTFIGLWLIDRIGRRALLYIGSFGYIISLAVASYTFLNTPTLKVASITNDVAADASTLIKVEQGVRFMNPDDRKGFDKGFAENQAALVEISKAEWYEGPEIVIPTGASAQEILETANAAKAKAGELIGATGTIVLAALIAFIAFIAAHAVGQGAVIWVSISEIIPNDHRAAGQTRLGRGLNLRSLWPQGAWDPARVRDRREPNPSQGGCSHRHGQGPCGYQGENELHDRGKRGLGSDRVELQS